MYMYIVKMVDLEVKKVLTRCSSVLTQPVRDLLLVVLLPLDVGLDVFQGVLSSPGPSTSIRVFIEKILNLLEINKNELSSLFKPTLFIYTLKLKDICFVLKKNKLQLCCIPKNHVYNKKNF